MCVIYKPSRLWLAHSTFFPTTVILTSRASDPVELYYSEVSMVWREYASPIIIAIVVVSMIVYAMIFDISLFQCLRYDNNNIALFDKAPLTIHTTLT